MGIRSSSAGLHLSACTGAIIPVLLWYMQSGQIMCCLFVDYRSGPHRAEQGAVRVHRLDQQTVGNIHLTRHLLGNGVVVLLPTGVDLTG